MTEGEHVDVAPSEALASLVLDRFGVSIRDVPVAIRGEEAIGWRGSSSDGDRFVQLFPTWRTVAELAWCDAVARAASTFAPVAVHAIASVGDEVVIQSREGPVMVFPFVTGTHPEGQRVATAAAALLADLHRGIGLSWDPARGPRPGARRWARRAPIERLVDEDLDRWERDIDARPVASPIHGDYYGGNLFVDDDRIVGVIDWSDADLAPFEHEVAWAAWECCQLPTGDELDDATAAAFLATYRAAGGPAVVGPPFDPLPWIRRRLRNEAGAWYADQRSATEPDDYYAAEVIAFGRLRRGFGTT